ncbi:MAG: HAD family phosphatase [Firmicutes bacterium]|nr:HAD family phosphatase [Bacillota bacterium]
MRYKLIATDCDGTLLNSEGFITKNTIDVFRKIHSLGVKVILATGRSDILAKEYALELGVDSPVIGCNGATMANFFHEENKRDFILPISRQSLSKMQEIVKSHGLSMKVFTPEKCYSDNRTLVEGGMGLVVVKYKRQLKISVPHLYREDILSATENEKAIKAVVIEKDINKLTSVKEDIRKNIKDVSAMQSNWNCIDIVNSSASKGNAVLEYAKKLGIKKEEIIAFGDSENDISLMENCGLGVAVGNADPHLKAFANAITKTNDEDGVAEFLKNEFL